MAFALNQDSVVKKLGDVDRMLSDWESSQILNAFVPNPHSPNPSPTQGTSPQHSTGFRGSYSPVFQDMATVIDETMTGTATINNPNLSATLHTQLGNLMRLENEVQQNKREWTLRMNNIKHDLGNAGVYSNAAFQPSENPVFSTTQSDAQHARPSPNATRTPGQVSYLSPSQYPTSKHDSMNDLTMTMINEQSQQVAKLMEAQLAMKEAFEEKMSKLEDVANAALEAVENNISSGGRRKSIDTSSHSTPGRRRSRSSVGSGSASAPASASSTPRRKSKKLHAVPKVHDDGHHSGDTGHHHSGHHHSGDDNDNDNDSSYSGDDNGAYDDSTSSMRVRKMSKSRKNMADKIADLHAKSKKKKTKKKELKKKKTKKKESLSPASSRAPKHVSVTERVNHSLDRKKFQPEKLKYGKFVPAGQHYDNPSFAWVGRQLKVNQL